MSQSGQGKKTDFALKFLASLGAAAAIGKLAKDADTFSKKAEEHRKKAEEAMKKAKQYGGSSAVPSGLPYRGFPFKNQGHAHDGVSANSNQRGAGQSGAGRLDRYLYDREASKSARFTSGSTSDGTRYRTAIIPDRAGEKRRYYFFQLPEGNVLGTRVPYGQGNNRDSSWATWVQGGSLSSLSAISREVIQAAYKEFKAQRGSGESKESESIQKYHIAFSTGNQPAATSFAEPNF